MKTMEGKKVLITGGLGFIGSNLARKCVKLGAKVTIFDCLDPRSGGNLYNIADIAESVQVSYHNILDFDQVSQVVPEKDIIFSCASSTSHAFSMREPWIDSDVNSKGVINLLEAVRRFNQKAKIVHLGALNKENYLISPQMKNIPNFPLTFIRPIKAFRKNTL